MFDFQMQYLYFVFPFCHLPYQHLHCLTRSHRQIRVNWSKISGTHFIKIYSLNFNASTNFSSQWTQNPNRFSNDRDIVALYVSSSMNRSLFDKMKVMIQGINYLVALLLKAANCEQLCNNKKFSF